MNNDTIYYRFIIITISVTKDYNCTSVYTGSMGLQGVQGVEGPVGPRGDTGPSGEEIHN